MSAVVEAYRQAVMDLYGLSEEEARREVQEPFWDWAPGSLALISLEGSSGLASRLHYFGNPKGPDECIRLQKHVGVGWIEDVHGGLAAVMPDFETPAQ